MASRTRPMSNWPPMVDLTPISTLSKSMKTAMRLRAASVGITEVLGLGTLGLGGLGLRAVSASSWLVGAELESRCLSQEAVLPGCVRGPWALPWRSRRLSVELPSPQLYATTWAAGGAVDDHVERRPPARPGVGREKGGPSRREGRRQTLWILRLSRYSVFGWPLDVVEHDGFHWPLAGLEPQPELLDQG